MNTNRRRRSSHSNTGDWQKERAARLHRQFKRVEQARQQGKSVNAALAHFSWYWRGEHYRSNPDIKVHFSIHRLRNLFYQWQRGGRNPRAIALKYAPANRRIVTRKEQAHFLKHASAPGTLTFAAAWQSMQRTLPVPFTLNHLCQSLPSSVRRELRRLFSSRRKQRGIETRFKRFVAKGVRP
jgi:hypothetical protein